MKRIHNHILDIHPGMKIRLLGADPFQGRCWSCFETVTQVQEDGILIFEGFEELRRYTIGMNWEIQP